MIRRQAYYTQGSTSTALLIRGVAELQAVYPHFFSRNPCAIWYSCAALSENGTVAEWLMRGIANPVFVGSIPARASNFFFSLTETP